MITRSILQVQVRSAADVVLARQRAQAIAEIAGFDAIKQTSFATAISEIARNAVQFAREGRVGFTIESYGNLHFLTASVIDNGPGIAPEQQEEVFARFHRSGAPRGEAALGLGLPLTRQFVEAHGGKVQLESALGKGTSVTLTIPRAPQ